MMAMATDGLAATVELLRDWDAWAGGFYELCIQLGPPDDPRLGIAARVLADAARVEGPWHVQWEPGEVRAANWTVADLAQGQLRGLVKLPGGEPVICSVLAVREEDDGDDWLDLCLPLGALGRLDSRIGGFPFGEEGGPVSLAWRRPIDDWLVRVARTVGDVTGFKAAVIGFEVSGSVRAEEMTEHMPGDRGYGLLLSPQGVYHPATF
jgi:hypothetical protein